MPRYLNPRARRMVETLPLLLQDGDNVQALFAALTAELNPAERAVLRLMRSRWVALADGWGGKALAAMGGPAFTDADLARLAGLVGLSPIDGETDAYFRRRLALFVALHREGLTTPGALLKLLALQYLPQPLSPEALRLEAVPEPSPGTRADRAAPRITRLHFDAPDPHGRLQTPPRARKPVSATRPRTLSLIDHPPLPARSRHTQLHSGEEVVVTSWSPDEATPLITLQAVGGPLLFPSLVNVETGQALIFLGLVPQDARLTLSHGRRPRLSPPESSPPTLSQTARADASGPARWPVASWDPYLFGDADARLGGRQASLQVQAPRFGQSNAVPDMFARQGEFSPAFASMMSAYAGCARFAAFEVGCQMPPLLSGDSTWRFELVGAEEAQRGNTLEEQLALALTRLKRKLAGCAGWERLNPFPEQRWGDLESFLEALAIGMRQELASLKPAPRTLLQSSANLSFEWMERRASTFRVQLSPPDFEVGPDGGASDAAARAEQLRRRLQRTLDYGRAAGVKGGLELHMSLAPERVWREKGENAPQIRFHYALSYAEQVSAAPRVRFQLAGQLSRSLRLPPITDVLIEAPVLDLSHLDTARLPLDLPPNPGFDLSQFDGVSFERIDVRARFSDEPLQRTPAPSLAVAEASFGLSHFDYASFGERTPHPGNNPAGSPDQAADEAPSTARFDKASFS